jgi:dTDP-4-amino-4,6-dideoxygalactose transaminase
LLNKVPLLDLKAQYQNLRPQILEALDRVCDSQHFILGPEVTSLEDSVARFCGVKSAVGVSSGTDALLVALMAIGVGPGDEVITSAYSFFATAGVIARLGARPVFVDIDPETFNMDFNQVRSRIGSRTRAIIPVHLFGRCMDLDPLLAVAKRAGIAVIEDAAQSLGASDSQNKQAGALGLMGCFSFFPSKNLGGFGDGGIVVTSNSGIGETLQVLRVHGSKPKYHHRIVGGNFRLDALQAAVLNVKMPHLPQWIQERRRNASRYRDLFEAARLLDCIRLPQDHPGHTYNQFVVRTAARDQLKAFLQEHGVETEVYYPLPLHLQECFHHLGYQRGDLPEAERASLECLALPVYPELEEDQQRYVVEQIRAFFKPHAQSSKV